MKVSHIAAVIALTLSPTIFAADMSDAKSMGMAGVGVAAGDFTRANLNPALLTKFDVNDDVYIKLGVGAAAHDFQDTIDKVDDVQHQLDIFEGMVNVGAGGGVSPEDAQQQADLLIADLKGLDKEKINASVGVDLAVYMPSKTFAFGMAITSQVWAKGDFRFADSDEQLLENAYASGDFNQTDIKSDGTARGIAVTSIDFNFARQFDLPVIGEFAVGVTPKVQRLDTYAYTATIANYDDSDYFEDQYRTDKTGFNFDLGLHKNLGMVELGLVARNLVKQEIVNIKGEKVTLEPTVVAGVAVTGMGMTAALDVDLIKDKSFVLDNDQFLQERQWARLGLEADIFEQVQVRAGYKTDLANNYQDYYSVGLGLSPFDLFSLDIAAEMSEHDDYGANLQLGFKF
ncbi:conjugal transfer protein TraF [Shewanella marina]|uniref:conjugal transfer protein TraF n=1 Tax=Shewanella marina TaxID=487319 RepID=UPI000471F019|nr:conjugal transfer protein TraF [Shewanella marina]